jgi:hypothetical protein
MAGNIKLEDLQPGAIVRVGLRASGPIHRSFCFKLLDAGSLQPDGQVRLHGDRLTYRLRPVERITITVPLNELHAVITP